MKRLFSDKGGGKGRDEISEKAKKQKGEKEEAADIQLTQPEERLKRIALLLFSPLHNIAFAEKRGG